MTFPQHLAGKFEMPFGDCRLIEKSSRMQGMQYIQLQGSASRMRLGERPVRQTGHSTGFCLGLRGPEDVVAPRFRFLDCTGGKGWTSVAI